MSSESGVLVRAATERDAEGISETHVVSWRETYAGIMPADFLAELVAADRRAMWERVLGDRSGRYRVVVAVHDADGIIGFASGAITTGGPQDAIHGEVMSIYVLRRFHRRGIGKQLFLAVVGALEEQGAASISLWVLADNPTRGFYEHLGGAAGEHKAIDIGGVALDEVEYVWPTITTLNATIGETDH